MVGATGEKNPGSTAWLAPPERGFLTIPRPQSFTRGAPPSSGHSRRRDRRASEGCENELTSPTRAGKLLDQTFIMPPVHQGETYHVRRGSTVGSPGDLDGSLPGWMHHQPSLHRRRR